MMFQRMTYSKDKMIRIEMLNEHQSISIMPISSAPGKIARTSPVKRVLGISCFFFNTLFIVTLGSAYMGGFKHS